MHYEIDFNLLERFMRGYPLRELADVLGVSPQAVSNRIKNIKDIRLREFFAICNHTGTDPVRFYYKKGGLTMSDKITPKTFRVEIKGESLNALQRDADYVFKQIETALQRMLCHVINETHEHHITQNMADQHVAPSLNEIHVDVVE